MIIIPEVKTDSPFGWKAKESWYERFKIADRIAQLGILSIHTDLRWNGSPNLITLAKMLTDVPLFAKGIHRKDSEINDVMERGAGLFLSVGRIPGVHIEDSVIEPMSLDELEKIPATMRALWNTRNLLDGGKPKIESFEEARRIFPGWLGYASNIESIDDVHAAEAMGANAVVIGTHLPRLEEPLLQYQETHPLNDAERALLATIQ